MPPPYALTESDRTKIANTIKSEMSRLWNKLPREYEPTDTASEVHIVRGSVPGRECAATSTSQGTKWKPGMATLPVYKLVTVAGEDLLEPVLFPDNSSYEIDVYNVHISDTAEDFGIALRDTFGKWYIEHNGDDSCSSSASESASDSGSESASDSGSESASASGSESASASDSASASGSASSSACGIEVVSEVTFDPVACDVTVTKIRIIAELCPE